jgi:hypothetical protein
MQNIAGYVFDHTSRDERRWHGLAANERGPYCVSALYSPREAEFLRLIRLHREKSPGCNPLDGREHSLSEIARWIGNTALAVRFVGLGVILSVFKLISPWEDRAGEGLQDTHRPLDRVHEGRFRLHGSRLREATEGSDYRTGTMRFPRRPGPRRPRYTRCNRALTCGFSRSRAM